MSRPNLYIFDDPEIDQRRLLLQAELFRDYIRDHAADFVPAPPARILDLGCSIGQLTVALHEIYPQAELVGIDRNPECISIARQQPGLQYASFVVGDIQEALPPGPFDLIYASTILSNIQDLARVVGLIHAALAPGGTLWVKDTHPNLLEGVTQPDQKYLGEIFLNVMQRLGSHPYVGAELPPLLTAAGFTIIRVEEDEVYPMGGATLEGESLLADWIAGARAARKMLQHVAGISEEEVLRRCEGLAAAAQASPEPIGVFRTINIIASE